MKPAILLIAGSLSQLGAFAPTTDRGGHLTECMAMGRAGDIGIRYALRCGWHTRHQIDEEVRMR